MRILSICISLSYAIDCLFSRNSEGPILNVLNNKKLSNKNN